MFRRFHKQPLGVLPTEKRAREATVFHRIGERIINRLAPPLPQEPAQFRDYLGIVQSGDAHIPGLDSYSPKHTFLEGVFFDPKRKTWLADFRLTDPRGEHEQIRTVSARQDSSSGELHMGWFDQGKIAPISPEQHRRGGSERR